MQLSTWKKKNIHIQYSSDCNIVSKHISVLISVYISEMRYYVHLYFSDYCPRLCRHVPHNVSAVVRSGLLQVVRMPNLTLYFAHWSRLFKFHEPCLMDVSYQLSPVNFPSESSPLPAPGIELTLFGYVTGSNQCLYPLYHVSLTYPKSELKTWRRQWRTFRGKLTGDDW